MAFYPLQDTATGAISASPNGCGRSSGVEHNLAKVRVGRSNRLARSNFSLTRETTRPPSGGLSSFWAPVLHRHANAPIARKAAPLKSEKQPLTRRPKIFFEILERFEGQRGQRPLNPNHIQQPLIHKLPHVLSLRDIDFQKEIPFATC